MASFVDSLFIYFNIKGKDEIYSSPFNSKAQHNTHTHSSPHRHTNTLTQIHQANALMINSFDFHFRQMKSTSDNTIQSHAANKPFKEPLFLCHYLKLPCLSPEFWSGTITILSCPHHSTERKINSELLALERLISTHYLSGT